MWHENIRNRTFGFELEFADADKLLLSLPAGYKWTDNKLTMMNNSDGSAVTHHGQYGGEINTRPYHYTEEDLAELRDFIQSLRDAGGYLMWNEGFDAHFYVKDFDLDVIKRLFALSYYTAVPVKKIFDFPEWWDTKYLAPTPTADVVKRALAADSLENFLKVFSNGSDRGHIRYWLNCVSIEKIGTVEFRIFNSSWNFEETLETIKFMYSFVEYAYLHEDMEEYKTLTTVEKCLAAFHIDPEKIPHRHKPLLWAAEHSDNMTVVGEMFKKSNRMLSYIKKASSKFDVVRVVNSYYFDIEQVINPREIVVYTKEYFIYLLFKAIKGEIKELTFDEEYSFLNIQSDKPSEIVATLHLFNAIKKHKKSDDIYHQGLYRDFVGKLEYYTKKYSEKYQKLVDNLSAKNISVKYCADLEDAILDCGSDDLVIYQSEFLASLRAASNAMEKALTEDFGIQERKRTHYASIDEERVSYLAITQHQYMGRKKVFRDGRTCIYSNATESGDNSFSKRTIVPLKYRRLPDDYQFSDKSQIRFMRASMSEIDYLRMIYLKKDIILGSAPFCYLWFIDDYVFGASMFDFMKVDKYGTDAVSMKSDFVIDHPLQKLSKLLIMGVLSTEYRDELCIRFKTEVGRICTSVFTDKPVSMKYRGVFDLDERGIGKLYYNQVAGKLGSLDSIMKEFLKRFYKSK